MNSEQKIDQHDERLREQERSIVELRAKLDSLATKEDMAKIHIALERNLADSARSRAEIERIISDHSKWMMGTMIALVIGYIGMFFAMRTSLKDYVAPHSHACGAAPVPQASLQQDRQQGDRVFGGAHGVRFAAGQVDHFCRVQHSGASVGVEGDFTGQA